MTPAILTKQTYRLATNALYTREQTNGSATAGMVDRGKAKPKTWISLS